MSGIRKIALVTQVPCREDVIDFLNKLDVDLIVGLGDVECPQYIKNYRGILGEMEDVTTQKYLRKNGLIIQDKILDLSISFSHRKVITHFPPRNPRGSQSVLGQIISNVPEIVFHGHLTEQKVYEIGKTKVVSVGGLENGYYVIYDGKEYELKRGRH